MISFNSFELRQAADRFREMCSKGDDMRIKVALLELAEEFEQEALDLEGGRVPRPYRWSPYQQPRLAQHLHRG